jgi:hypothetical protein
MIRILETLNQPGSTAQDGIGVWGGALLGVALGPQPFDLAVACEPLVDLGFGFEAVDVFGFDAGALGLDLPIALRNSLRFEGDPRRFCHQGNMRENQRGG